MHLNDANILLGFNWSSIHPRNGAEGVHSQNEIYIISQECCTFLASAWLEEGIRSTEVRRPVSVSSAVFLGRNFTLLRENGKIRDFSVSEGNG